MAKSYDAFYIGGEWVAPSSVETIRVVNPATEEPCATVPAGNYQVNRLRLYRTQTGASGATEQELGSLALAGIMLFGVFVMKVYTLDFNLAYNPYCAYSSAYGCAIPRKEDWLDLAITAGEKKWHDSQQLRELRGGGVELRLKLSSLAEVARGAIRDAGLRKDDIDGLISSEGLNSLLLGEALAASVNSLSQRSTSTASSSKSQGTRYELLPCSRLCDERRPNAHQRL